MSLEDRCFWKIESVEGWFFLLLLLDWVFKNYFNIRSRKIKLSASESGNYTERVNYTHTDVENGLF